MSATRIFISYNTKDVNDYQVANALKSYLNQKYDAFISGEAPINTSQWVVVIRPRGVAAISQEVSTALNMYIEGQLQGVLALANTPTEAEELDDIPSRLSAISTYDLGTPPNMAQAFEHVVKTINYSDKTVGVTTSSQTNGNTALSMPNTQVVTTNSPSSRNLSSFFTSIRQKPLPFIVVSLLIVILLAIIPVSLYLSVSRSSSQTVKSTANPTAPSTSVVTSIPTKTLNLDELYKNSTQGTPVVTLASTAADKSSLWDNNATCVPNGSGNAATYTAILEATTPLTYAQPCMAKKTTIGNNFAFQVRMNISKGDAGGVIFQSDNGLENSYRFSLSSAGEYKLILCEQCTTPGNGNPLFDNTITPPSGPSILTVIVANNIIYLYINKKFVLQQPDIITTPGQVGVYAGSTIGNPTMVVFSNVKVWNLS